MNKILAFDVDITLADNHSNIQPGVQSVFLDKRIHNCAVIFATGNTLSTIQRMRKNLNNLAQQNLPTRSYSAILGGSLIYDKNDQLIYEKHIKKQTLVDIMNASIQIDPKSFFLTMHQTREVFLHITTDKILQAVKAKLDHINMDKNEMEFDDQDYTSAIKNLEPVHELLIFSLKDLRKIFDAIEPIVSSAGYYCYFNQSHISISAGSKLKALKYIVKHMRAHNGYTKKLKDVVYFGNGQNDLDCLRACNTSIARGKDLEPEVIASSKIYADDVTPYLDEIFR